MSTDSLTDTLTAALTYAARGWHVFPLHPDTKRPARPGHRATDCLSGGFGGPTGTDPFCRGGHAGWDGRATTDPDRIRRAWSSRPYGIGIAAGPSNLVVIDLDVAKDDETAPGPWARFGITTGAQVLAHLAGVHGGTITPTWTVRTISGGTHLYYRAPAGTSYGNTVRGIGWLIDTRATGGYVVAPPTTIAGVSYQVTDDRPVAELPASLVDLLGRRRTYPSTRRDSGQAVLAVSSGAGTDPARPVVHASAYVAAVLKREAAYVANAPDGKHNHTLFCASVALGQLIAGGALSEHDAYGALAEAAAALIGRGCNCTPAEVDATIRSGFTTGARNPRNPNTRTNTGSSRSRRAA